MSIKNFKLTIQYDGTSYSGWQIQKDQDTIQGKLKDCIGKIARQDNVNVVGSGRTDSGVHALGQVANFKIDTNMDEEDLRKAINANIPKDIKVECPKPNIIKISSSNKELLGTVASKIRSFRKPEPFKGKGIKYENEFIFRKEGKKK